MAFLVFPAELDPDFGIPGLGFEAPFEFTDGVPALDSVPKPVHVFFGRRNIPRQPVAFDSVRVQDQDEGRAADSIGPDELLAGDLAAGRSKKDKTAFKEGRIAGIVVNLLTQQDAIPSAGLGEEIDQQELPFRFGLGQSFFDRACTPGQRGSGNRQAEEEKREKRSFFHHRLPYDNYPQGGGASQ
ncbi:MAG: hypothetical protein ABSA30_02875 [Candidatus Aminicenantales bacterium]|jgi:hypothetical protein